MTVHACTIIARNYLAAARVLAQSFFEHHPDGEFTTLVVDDVIGLFDDSKESFKTLRLDEIGIEHEELLKMVAIYTVMELCTAVKPWLLQSLHEAGADSVLYIDPDIKIYGPLDELASQSKQFGIALTPHVTKPLPRDGKSTSESEILASGIYNCGFIGVGAQAKEFLTFWMERLRRDCVSDPEHMRFVDQRWVDFAPSLFNAHIAGESTYNVAYWNLSERIFDWDGVRYTVDGAPLKFFHFSGYDPRVPYLLSKHQGIKPRVLLSERPALQRICDEYGADLLVNGYSEELGQEYGYARLANGARFDAVMRKTYRAALLESEIEKTPSPPNPFHADEEARFLEWLNEVPTSGPSRRISRYLEATYADRPDLQVEFADLEGRDFERFAEWSRHDAAMGRLDYRFAIPLNVAEGSVAEVLRPGIRIAGYLRAETGVGELGRLAATTAQHAGLESGTYVDTNSVSRQAHEFAETNRTDLNVNLVCVNADQLPFFAKRVGPGFFKDRYTIGLWAWEIEEFPARYSGAFDFVDEVWAISAFTQQAIAAVTDKPVISFPLPIAPPQPPTSVTRADLGVPDGFIFLFCFDLMSVIERKNPFGLVEAFCNAFREGEGPTLVIKAVNSTLKTNDLEHLKSAAKARSDIRIIDRYLDADENVALMAACDCYVSLHRSEGFGLTMGEAMALGKPVIATAYSGNLDFMTEETSYLIPWEYTEISTRAEPYRPGARWAEPDLGVASEKMRYVFSHQEEAAALGDHARRHVLAHHGFDARSSIMMERFERAQEEIRTGRISPKMVTDMEPQGPTNPAVELIALAQRAPDVNIPGRFSKASRFIRRIVLRVLKHHDAHQNDLNMQLALGIGHMMRLMNEARAESAASLAAIESELESVRAAIESGGKRFTGQDQRLTEIEDRLGTSRPSSNS